MARIDPTAAPEAYPEKSPTGATLVPQWVVRAAVFVVAVAAAGAAALPDNTLADHVCQIIVGAGAIFGIVSQGVRK